MVPKGTHHGAADGQEDRVAGVIHVDLVLLLHRAVREARDALVRNLCGRLLHNLVLVLVLEAFQCLLAVARGQQLLPREALVRGRLRGGVTRLQC